MKWIDRFTKALTMFLEGIITVFFFVMLILVILLVILRYVFSATIIGGNEALQFLFIYTSAFGAAVAVGKRQHIKISVLLQQLPIQTQKIIDVLNHILIMILNGYLIALSITWISSVGYFQSPVLRIPRGVVQVSIPIGCGLLILYGICNIIADFLSTNKDIFRG